MLNCERHQSWGRGSTVSEVSSGRTPHAIPHAVKRRSPLKDSRKIGSWAKICLYM